MSPAQEPPKPAIQGLWRSAAAEDLGNGAYGRRELRITGDHWSARVRIYLDRDGKTPLMAVQAEGVYEIGQASPGVKGAQDVVFLVSRKRLTLLTRDKWMIRLLGVDGCGLGRRGQTADLTSRDCGPFPSAQACPREYDIVRQDGDRLFFGARVPEAPPCTEDRRPVSWGGPLIRQ